MLGSRPNVSLIKRKTRPITSKQISFDDFGISHHLTTRLPPIWHYDLRCESDTHLRPRLDLRQTHHHITAIMSLPTKAATSLVRHAARQQTPALRSSAAVAQCSNSRTYADASTSHAHYNSPFSRGTSGKQDTTAIPSFKNYRSGSETSNKLFQYFMVGAMGGVSALGAKNTVQGEIYPLEEVVSING